MDYKGYRIGVYWKHSRLGYIYSIYEADGSLVKEGTEIYFHKENAEAEARKEIDQMI